MTGLLSESDHRRVTAAVTAAEAKSDGEIVTIAAAFSSRYRDVALWWTIMIVLLVPIAVYFVPLDFLAELVGRDWSTGPAYGELILFVFAMQLLAGVATHLLLGFFRLRLGLTLERVKRRRVRRKAIAYFKAAAERRTVGLTGILIYLSLAERRAEIVADDAIFDRVEEGVWAQAMDALLAEVRTGDPAGGMVAAVEHVGFILAEHFPKSDGNPNELPDRLIEV